MPNKSKKIGNDGESSAVLLEIPNSLIAKIDLLKAKWGLRSRGAIVVRLLEEILEDGTGEDSLETNIQDVALPDFTDKNV
jgi:hypothetical protein